MLGNRFYRWFPGELPHVITGPFFTAIKSNLERVPFPDFNERFFKTGGGWFAPKAGHEQEMQYREAMRQMDQDLLVRKRNESRYRCGSAEKNGQANT